jgi:hypothetical protein
VRTFVFAIFFMNATFSIILIRTLSLQLLPGILVLVTISMAMNVHDSN